MALLAKRGTVESLRVNERGDRFGGKEDNITAEVIVQLHRDGGAYGFRLLDDADRPVRQGYLDLLRDAMNFGHDVKLDVEIDEGKAKGMIVRVMVLPQPDRPSPAISRRLRPMVANQPN